MSAATVSSRVVKIPCRQRGIGRGTSPRQARTPNPVHGDRTMTTSTNPRGLFVALELGWDKGLLTCATAPAEKPRFRNITARDVNALLQELAKAKETFGLPDD